MSHLTVGLDVHARETEFAVVDENGRTIESGRIPTLRENLRLLTEPWRDAIFVMEASSVHEWVYDTLTATNVHALVVHPVKIADITGKKNDKVDAKFLANAYRLGMLRPAYVPPLAIRELRELSRYRAFLTFERTRIKNRVHGILKRKGIRVTDEENVPVDDVFTKRARSQLANVAHPEIPALLELIDDLTKRIQKAERQLTRVARKNAQIQNLTTIPGFGNFTSIALYAEIGDVNRFASSHAMASYFGLVPSETQSGDTLTRGRITKKGSRIVRWLLTQAAWVHVGTAPKSSLTKDYKSLARRAGKQKAITMVSRKLVVCAWHLLKENRQFRSTG